MFYKEQINILTDLEKAVLLDIVNNIFPCGQKIEEDFLYNLRKDTTLEKLNIALIKLKEDDTLKKEATEVIEQIKLKLKI